MKNVFIPTLVLAVGFACQAAAFASDKPPKSPTPLGADELAIYKAIVPQQSVKNSGVVNVSNTTLPLRSNSPFSGLSRKGVCKASSSTIFSRLTVRSTNCRPTLC
jgi:hypothetical protein